MFIIKRIADKRVSDRVCASLGAEMPGAFAYGAFKNDDVLATAAFSLADGCVVFHGVDTGRRLDIDLVDGLARAAFSGQLRAGTKQARLGEGLSPQVRQALSKLGYDPDEAFALNAFFARKNCRRT